MLIFEFPLAQRRRRLALGGAIFLAFDALLMGVVIAWITQGRHLGLAFAFAAVGVFVSLLLAWALVRPPRATFVGGELRVEAAHRVFTLDSAALRNASISEVDLSTLAVDALPRPLQSSSRWATRDAMGWQHDGSGAAIFCAITRIGPALRIDAGESGSLLWTPQDTAAVKRAITAA